MTRMMNKTWSCNTRGGGCGGLGRSAEKVMWLREWVNEELFEAMQDEYIWRAARRRREAVG